MLQCNLPNTMRVKRAVGGGHPSAGPAAQLQHMPEGVMRKEKYRLLHSHPVGGESDAFGWF